MCEEGEAGRGVGAIPQSRGYYTTGGPPPAPGTIGFGKPKSGLMEPWARGQTAINHPPSSLPPSLRSIAPGERGQMGERGGANFKQFPPGSRASS